MKLDIKADGRGELAEFVKHPAFGQVFVTRTYSGEVRGNHYHHRKVEKFLVVEGRAVIRLRERGTSIVQSIPVCGEDFDVVDIPVETVHSFENVGERDLVVIVWSNEIFDPNDSDTHREEV